jgi:hypothetical protein
MKMAGPVPVRQCLENEHAEDLQSGVNAGLWWLARPLRVQAQRGGFLGCQGGGVGNENGVGDLQAVQA